MLYGGAERGGLHATLNAGRARVAEADRLPFRHQAPPTGSGSIAHPAPVRGRRPFPERYQPSSSNAVPIAGDAAYKGAPKDGPSYTFSATWRVCPQSFDILRLFVVDMG